MRCFNLLGAVVDEAEERFRVPLIFTCQARFKFLRAIYIPRVIISIDVGACPARKKEDRSCQWTEYKHGRIWQSERTRCMKDLKRDAHDKKNTHASIYWIGLVKRIFASLFAELSTTPFSGRMSSAGSLSKPPHF